MRQVNLREARANLSRLVALAAAGEEIIIAKAGKPVARLVPLTPDLTPRKLDSMRGKIWMADDFNAPLPPDILASFYGDDDAPPDEPDDRRR
jgi:prevent-host-death family protein